MKFSSSLLLFATVATLGGLSAHAESYGINFLGNIQGPKTPGTDNVTGTAGVVPIGNFNNIATASTANTINSSDLSTTATLTLSGTASGYSTVGTPPNTGGNASLEDGYIDAGGQGGANGGVGTAQETFTLTGLTSSSYNIYIYNAGDAGRPGNAGDGLPDYTINGTSYYTAVLGGAFTGFVQGQTQSTEANVFPSPVTAGNYILVSGVVPTAGGTITIGANEDNHTYRSPVDGLELIGVPEPSPLALGFFGVIGAVVLMAVRNRRIKAA